MLTIPYFPHFPQFSQKFPFPTNRAFSPQGKNPESSLSNNWTLRPGCMIVCELIKYPIEYSSFC